MISARRAAQRTLRTLTGAGTLALAMVVQVSIQAPLPALAATVLYSDNFEADAIGAAPAGWNVTSGTWSVALDGTHVMKETDTNTATAKSISTGSGAWKDYAVQAQLKPGAASSGLANVLSARYTNDNNSYGLILKDGTSWYFGKKVNGVWTTFASGAFAYNTSTWYQFEIDVVGSSLSAFINGAKLASATDSTFSSGAIDVMSRYTLEVDNVIVTALNGPPPPSPSPSPSPSSSPSPSPSASPSSSVIRGVVSDVGTGAPIAGARVTTQPASTTATTGSGGSYTLNVAAGTYDVLVSAPGYNTNFIGAVKVPSSGTATASKALVRVPPQAAQDLFSRPNQSGLGTASDGHTWSSDLNLNPTAKVSIVGGQDFVQTASANADLDTWMGIAYRDEEITADLNMVNVLQDPNFQHGGRLLARVQGVDSWLVLALNPSNSTLTIWVDNSGNWTQIGSASLHFSTNTWYHAKFDVIGSNASGKAWVFGSAEPGWQVTGSQTAIMSPGVGGLRVGAADVYFANYTETPLNQIPGASPTSPRG